MKKPWGKFFIGGLLVLISTGFLLIAIHNVPKTITKEDADYIYKISDSLGYDWQGVKKHENFEDEIADIRTIQSAVLKLTPVQKQIPNYHTREPKDLYELRYAQCSDRSRVMDKMLRLAGFESRVASIYDTSNTGSALQSLLTTDKNLVRSHSMVEVKTSKGWVMVDTNDLWLGLDQDMQPVSLEKWQSHVHDKKWQWNRGNTGDIYPLMTKDFTYIYGLYSRHGKFYAPYTPIPDYNFGELLQNF